MGPHPEDGVRPGYIPSQGCAADYREATAGTGGWKSWEYPPLTEAMGEGGFEGIRKLVRRRKNTVVHYIVTLPIIELCERATQQPGARVSWRWWEHDGIELEGEKKREAEETTVSESKSESESDLE